MLVVLASGTSSLAQDFGLKGGINISGVRTGYDVLDNAVRPGWHAGVFKEVGDEEWRFQIEGMLSCLGTKIELSSEIQTTRVLYVHTPLNLKYQTQSGFNFQLGFYMGFRIHASQKLTEKSTDTTTKANITSNITFFDFGPSGGLGYDFGEKFGIELKYYYGIPNINANSNVNLKMYSQFWQLSALYTINRKGD